MGVRCRWYRVRFCNQRRTRAVLCVRSCPALGECRDQPEQQTTKAGLVARPRPDSAEAILQQVVTREIQVAMEAEQETID